MHIWGPDKAQKVIFVDEAERYFNSGWRDHPSKVGLPLNPVATPNLESPEVEQDIPQLEAPVKRGRGRKQ